MFKFQKPVIFVWCARKDLNTLMWHHKNIDIKLKGGSIPQCSRLTFLFFYYRIDSDSFTITIYYKYQVRENLEKNGKKTLLFNKR